MWNLFGLTILTKAEMKKRALLLEQYEHQLDDAQEQLRIRFQLGRELGKREEQIKYWVAILPVDRVVSEAVLHEILGKEV